MYIGIKKVFPLPDYKLRLVFENDVEKIFNVKPLLNKGRFAELKDEKLYNSVHVSFDTIAWSNGLDLCPEDLYTMAE